MAKTESKEVQATQENTVAALNVSTNREGLKPYQERVIDDETGEEFIVDVLHTNADKSEFIIIEQYIQGQPCTEYSFDGKEGYYKHGYGEEGKEYKCPKEFADKQWHFGSVIRDGDKVHEFQCTPLAIRAYAAVMYPFRKQYIDDFVKRTPNVTAENAEKYLKAADFEQIYKVKTHTELYCLMPFVNNFGEKILKPMCFTFHGDAAKKLKLFADEISKGTFRNKFGRLIDMLSMTIKGEIGTETTDAGHKVKTVNFKFVGQLNATVSESLKNWANDQVFECHSNIEAIMNAARLMIQDGLQPFEPVFKTALGVPKMQTLALPQQPQAQIEEHTTFVQPDELALHEVDFLN